MTVPLTVFEFGYLTCDEQAAQANGYTLISANAFHYLERLCLNENKDNVGRFLKLCSRYGDKLLQVRNYVGVLFTPNGEHIEVLPKVAKKTDNSPEAIDESRKLLLMMLKHLGEFRHIANQSANVDTLKMPLLEVFIQQFLHSVNQLVKRGLRSDYVKQQDNLGFKKGKLLVAKQVRYNSVNKHKFYCEFDDFLQNRPANRLIRAALKKVAAYTRRNQNQKLLRELDFTFDGIPASTNVKQDFARVKLDRGMDYYQSPLAWARLILEGFSPLSMKGSADAQSLLFPMESVFESYVASMLRRNLADGVTLSTQVKSEYLVHHNGHRQFQLRPDLMLTKSDNLQVILDTKWKLIDLTAHNYGLSQSDMYQMFAYGHKYLQGEGDLFLIYPAHSDFQEAIKHSFDFDEASPPKLRLWVIPFVISLNGDSKVKWPKEFSEYASVS
ncbi:restriction endonuclease [Vibrio toranzoniae]|uniref:Restriction endonuclease n=1 Tax=Vibrio toranzoniae TaxID=1194427 RepID=A0A109D9W7_9VIBR|nr:McrC family protein [Vibrio toranzoniae]KWU01492.1 restriction endonuclease [Vibrio toranzoniae]